MNINLFFSILATACVYSALATAIVLVYRSNHVLTFHVGEVGVLAAYVAATAMLHFGEEPFGSLSGLAAGLIAGLVMGATMHVVVDRWARSLGPFVGTVLTIAVAIILIGVSSLIWSGKALRLSLASGQMSIGGNLVPNNSIVVIALCAIAVAFVQVVVAKTRLGINMRAVANNAALARIRGIRVPQVLFVVWLFAGCLTALGGIGSASLSSVSLDGAFIGVSAVVAAIMGGMTSLPGALLGAAFLAAGEQMVSFHFDARYSHVVPVLALVLVLIFRPSGLTGRVERIERL